MNGYSNFGLLQDIADRVWELSDDKLLESILEQGFPIRLDDRTRERLENMLIETTYEAESWKGPR